MSGNICRCSAYANIVAAIRDVADGGRSMKPFHYERASAIASACASAAEPTAKFIAGGTNLVDLMKLEIETPAQLVDIGQLPLDDIEETAEGGLRIGARVTIAPSLPICACAAAIRCCHRQSWRVRQKRSLRNKATTGGKSAPAHAVPYFYERAKPATTRAGSGWRRLRGLTG